MTDDINPPPGFRIHYPDEPFEMHAGPHYLKEVDGSVIGGFRAQPFHANSNAMVHGGALTTFADSILPVYALREIDTQDHWIATITLNTEFLSPAFVGDWLECQGELTKLTRSLAFVSGQVRVDDRIILNCSTVLKIIPKR